MYIQREVLFDLMKNNCFIEGSPQLLGALEAAETNNDIANVGFEVHRYFEKARPAHPFRSSSRTHRPKTNNSTPDQAAK